MRVAGLYLVSALAADTWVPIEVNGKYQYFNPESNKLVEHIPHGAKTAPVVQFLETAQEPIGEDADAEEPDVPVSQSQTESAAKSVSAVTAGAVEESDAKSCYPRCSWNCTQPICNQDCSPECEQPTCQTRCPKPDYSQCKIDCTTPHCSVFCPKDPCHSNPGTKCSSPKCSTQCARAVCALKCKNRVPCNNVCHPPRCTWNCRNPRACPKPECRLVCERPLGCAQNYELPPLSPALTVQQSFTADRARWVTYEWSQCGMKCGKSVQTRKVLCSTGQDHECQFGVKPATEQECEDLSGCNQWQKGTWGKCSAVCGKGKMTRKVWCGNDDTNECFGDKPEMERECLDEGQHCQVCKVTLHGGPYHTGWSANFVPGEYNTEALIAKGAKCEEVSSITVEGACCRASVYQYGDFNERNKGWEAEFKNGKHDVDALEEAGVKDNDVSAMDVYFAEDCGAAGRKKAGGLFGSLGGGGAARRHGRRHRHSGRGGSDNSGGLFSGDGSDGSGSVGGASNGGVNGGVNGGSGSSRNWLGRGTSGSRGGRSDGDDDEKDVSEDLSEGGSSWGKALSGGKGGKSGGSGGSGWGFPTGEDSDGTSSGGSGGSGGKSYPWWFWLLIGVIVVGVVIAVVLACRRR
mmetsp:Transcript_23039/g.50673  ORF Transcript_23039/g.50673 Transcript_23039/m.50673 type:complete len:632 (+) Transcript_23039:105-2000(+)